MLCLLTPCLFIHIWIFAWFTMFLLILTLRAQSLLWLYLQYSRAHTLSYCHFLFFCSCNRSQWGGTAQGKVLQGSTMNKAPVVLQGKERKGAWSPTGSSPSKSEYAQFFSCAGLLVQLYSRIAYKEGWSGEGCERHRSVLMSLTGPGMVGKWGICYSSVKITDLSKSKSGSKVSLELWVAPTVI